jgi:NADPH:quinone reductase
MSECIVATGYGDEHVLALVDQLVPAPGPGEVLLEVRAAGVSPIDFKVYSGALGKDPSTLPMRLGTEAAGKVLAVGASAIGPLGPIAAGDEVIAYRVAGAYAKQLVAPASAFLPKPPKLEWAEAAGLMLTGATAIHMLVATEVQRGDTVLLHAAAGGVGQMVIQIAKARGARVIGTASPDQHELLRALGATPVAYGPGLLERVRSLAPGGVQVALDAIGGDEALDVSLALVSDRKRIATIVASPRAFKEGVRVLGGAPGADPGTAIRDAARAELVKLVTDGQLNVRVERTFPLAQAGAAHHLLASGHVHGKIVLLP